MGELEGWGGGSSFVSPIAPTKIFFGFIFYVGVVIVWSEFLL